MTKLQFQITVAYNGTDAASVVETFRNLSMESDATNYAVTTINDRISGSKYILLTDLRAEAERAIGRRLSDLLVWMGARTGPQP